MNHMEKSIERGYCVYKSNDLIQKTRYDLTITEQKIVLRLIQLIQPSDTSFKWYNFDVQEFCDLCGIDRVNGGNYQHLKKTIKNLSDKSFWIKLPNGKDSLCRWINKARTQEGSGIIEIKLDEDLMPYLLQLKSNFTAYSLYYVLGMRSKYSPRLYELIKSHEFKGHFEINTTDLMAMMDAAQYDYKNFKQKVLDVATKEINDLTDIVIEYQPIKEKRKTVALRFEVRQKTSGESIEMYYANRERIDLAE